MARKTWIDRNTKLDVVAEKRLKRASRKTDSEIATELNVSRPTVSRQKYEQLTVADRQRIDARLADLQYRAGETVTLAIETIFGELRSGKLRPAEIVAVGRFAYEVYTSLKSDLQPASLRRDDGEQQLSRAAKDLIDSARIIGMDKDTFKYIDDSTGEVVEMSGVEARRQTAYRVFAEKYGIDERELEREVEARLEDG